MKALRRCAAAARSLRAAGDAATVSTRQQARRIASPWHRLAASAAHNALLAARISCIGCITPSPDCAWRSRPQACGSRFVPAVCARGFASAPEAAPADDDDPREVEMKGTHMRGKPLYLDMQARCAAAARWRQRVRSLA